jgi:hypothetical protein
MTTPTIPATSPPALRIGLQVLLNQEGDWCCASELVTGRSAVAHTEQGALAKLILGRTNKPRTRGGCSHP